MTLSNQIQAQIDAANERELLAREVRLLHAVAEAATQVRLHVVAIGGGRRVESAWENLCLALDAAGYGPDGSCVTDTSRCPDCGEWVSSDGQCACGIGHSVKA